MHQPKIKICGCKSNIFEVAQLSPAYMGFIFYNKSARYFDGTLPELPSNIKKVGVFVNEEINIVVQKIKKYNLNIVQLHGEESPSYCAQLNQTLIIESTKCNLWKVFSVKNTFNFKPLLPYLELVDVFLFDTKGDYPGGNGITFNWDIFKKYPFNKPFILSGGISNQHITALQIFKNLHPQLYAIDLNSKFEIQPGLKNISLLKSFINEL